MGEKLRISGLKLMGDITWGTHFCQFYQTQEELMNIIIPYLRAGLETNELCIWVMPQQPFETEKEIAEYFKKIIPKIDIYLDKGQIEIISCEDWCVENLPYTKKPLKHWLEKVDHALNSGYDGLRVVQDISWLKKEWKNLIDYEEELDSLVENCRMISLCTSSSDQFDTNETMHLALNHLFTLVKKEGKWEKLENPRLKKTDKTTFQAAKKIGTRSVEVNDRLEKLLEEKTVQLEKTCKLLEETEEYLTQVQKMASIGNWKWHIGTGELYWSDEVYRIFGRSHQEFRETYESFLSYIHPDDREYVINAIKKGFNGQLQNIDYRIILPDGEERVVHTQAEIIFDENNIPVRAEGIVQDITERKRTEAALCESEARLQVIVENSPDIIFEQDVDLRYTWIHNPPSPFSVSDILGKTDADILPPAQAKVLTSIKRRVLDTGTCEKANLQLSPADELRWYEVIYSPYYNEAGQVVGVLSYTRDFTERKKFEEALQESEEQYRAFFENSIDAVLLTSPDGTIHAANPAACKIFEMTEEEIIQAGRNGILDISDPRIKHALEERERSGKFRGELNFIRKDGAIFPGEVSSAFFKDKKGLDKTAMIIRDITQRKQIEEALRKSEEHYRLLFTNMNEAFFLGEIIYDENGKPHDYRFLELNPAFEAHTGIKGEDLLGKSHVEIFHKADLTVIERYGEVALSGKPIHFEFFTQLTNRYIDIYVFSPEKGKFAAIFRDITELKKMEERTRQRAEEIETVMEVAPVALWIGHDPLSCNITGNRMANELYEAKSGENVSLNSTSVRRFFREGRELTSKELPMQQASLKDIDIRNEEIDVLQAGGDLRTFLGSASPLHNSEGHVRGSVGVFVDITERKKAEAKLKETLDNLERIVKERTVELEKAYNSLKESEASLYEAQKMARIGNWDWDLTTNKLHASDEMCRIFGIKPQKFEASYEVFLNYVHPADRDCINKIYMDVLNGKELVGLDYRIISIDGEERVVHGQGEVIFNEENIPVRIRGTVQDITERKKTEKALELSEERYRIVAEQTGQLIYDYNVEKGTVDWAGSIKEITGYTLDIYQNMDLNFLLSHIHPDDRKMFLENYENFLMNGGVYRTEYRFRKENGEYIYVEDNGVCLKDEKGKVKRVIGATKDITERKKAERTLANIEIARKKEIHHRIKNNLQVISSLLDLQAEKFKSKKNAEDFEILSAFKESQDRVISISLIHEELHEGKGTNELNFSPYLEKLVENLFQTYKLGNIDLNLNMDLEENIFFDIDIAVPLGLIVNEIVSNSLKYAFSGRDKGIIQIKLCKDKSLEPISNTSKGKEGSLNKTANFILTVSDNGVGISENINLEDSGTLGLQLIAILVDQLGGKLELRRDSGAEFIIKFAVSSKE